MNSFTGKRFIQSGILKRYNAFGFRQIVQAYGGTIAYDVSRANVLVVGSIRGDIYQRGQELGIETWSESEFYEKLEEVGA